MKNISSKILAVILILTALTGWLGGGYAIFKIWQFEPKAMNWVFEKSSSLQAALENSENLLVVLDDFLENVENMIFSIENSVKNIDETLQTTAVLTEDLADLTGEDFPIMIKHTQTALTSVESSAKLIDDTLKIITILPFFKTRYEPDTPLAESIADVNQQFDRVPQMLTRMQGNLTTATGNLDDIQEDLDSLTESITEIQENLEKTRGVVSRYQEMIDQSQESLQKFEDRSPVLIHRFTWLLTAILIWLCFSQLTTFLLGLEKWGSKV